MNDLVEVAKSWLQAMNEHDVAKMSSLCWEDVLGYEVADPPPVPGREKIASNYRELFAAFPDCKAEILNMLSGPEQVLAEVQWKGTNKAEFRGSPATGKFIDIPIAYIFKIDGKKIRKITEYYDGATLAKQMGL